jgi:hypothetical protein
MFIIFLHSMYVVWKKSVIFELQKVFIHLNLIL